MKNIKNCIFVLCIVFMCWSCSEPQPIAFETIQDSIVSPVDTMLTEALEVIEMNARADSTIKPVIHQPSYEKLFNPSNKIIPANIPFGCDILIKHNFPKHWATDAYGDIDSILPHEKEFDDLSECFHTINVGPLTSLPSIKKAENVIYGKMTKCMCNDSLSLSLLHCRYQLPDFGPYQCYYVFSSGSDCNNCLEYGNLLLVDSLSHNAKMLNVYAETSGDQHVSFRFFYIDSDKSIQIFEGSCYDDGCSLINKFTIRVQQNGQILIKENN